MYTQWKGAGIAGENLKMDPRKEEKGSGTRGHLEETRQRGPTEDNQDGDEYYQERGQVSQDLGKGFRVIEFGH